MKQNQLSFSIIIPTYNRPGQLAACLDSLTRLDYPSHFFEVIVVDDGSKIPPEAVVARFREKLDLTLLLRSHAGPASARNVGARRARGKFLVFTDDDCQPAEDWLQKIEGHFNENQTQAVGGPLVDACSDNPYSKTSHLLLDSLYRYFNREVGAAQFLTSSNMAFPGEKFKEIGGFDESFPLAAGEDREFCDRWRHDGHKIMFDSAVRIYHTKPMAFGSFFNQHFSYGRGAFYFHRARGRRTGDGIKVEPFSFYWDLLHSPFAQDGLRSKFLISTLLLISQVANAAGFFWEALNSKKDFR